MVAYLGTVDLAAMTSRMESRRETGGDDIDGGGVGSLSLDVDGSVVVKMRGRSPTLMALPLAHLLSKESIEARVVPGVGPMPVFNASCAPGGAPLQIWGLTAQILHAVMRVVVGARPEYRDALYEPFMRTFKSAGG